MAAKPATDPGDVEELLDTVDKTLERLRTMYEQYFLGIQKQAPTFIHNDVERKLRDLTQMQLRNTGLRYRLATLQQKFGSYNSYWRRTLRQIEQGTYFRNLSKVGREAIRTGADIPEEILAAMPKRMREQVVRDREQALAIARRRDGEPEEMDAPEDVIAMIKEPTELRRNLKTVTGAHVVDEDDGDIDLAAFFASVEEEATAPKVAAPPLRAATITTPPAMRPARTTGPIQTQTQPRTPRPTGPVPTQPMPTRSSGSVSAVPPPAARQTGPVPVVNPPATRPTGASPAVPPPTPRQTGAIPVVPPPAPKQTGAIPRVTAPSQVTRPTPIVPGAAAAKGAVPVESMAGPFPRPPTPKPQPAAPQKPPPGMSDADVNALYAKYVKAKEMVGEKVGPGEHSKLLKTINAQAPKIMEQYNAKAVDFSVVVKDNQVIIRAKPKT